jgi:cytochrome P450
MQNTAKGSIPTAPRLPFVGSLPHILCSRSDFLLSMAQRLGDLYWLDLAGQRVLIVGHPADAALILDDRCTTYPDKGGSSGFRHLTLPFVGGGLSTWNGMDLEWHRRRRAISKLFEPRRWPAGWHDLHSVRAVPPDALLLFVQQTVVSDLAEMLIGYQPSPAETEVAADCLQQLSSTFWKSRFPGPHPIDGARSSRSKKQLESLVSTWILRSDQPPLWDCLPHLSAEELRDEVLSQLLSAGTLAVCSIWGLHLLATHPTEQVAARISATSNDADKKDYLAWTVKELLRLCPATYWIQRRSQESAKLSNFILPADTRVVVSVMRAHTHPEYWTQPDQFNPRRFDGNATTPAWMPFGRGPRICLGRHYSLAMLRNLLAGVLSRYHIRETESTKPRLLPRFSLLPHPLPQLTFDPL